MKIPDNVEVFETPLLTCWFEDDGILYSVSKKADRSIENYRALFELYAKLSENGIKKICTLGDITETQPMSREVREYVSAETPKYLKAMALISSSITGKAAGRIFQILSISPYPIAMFANKDDAAKWLKQHL